MRHSLSLFVLFTILTGCTHKSNNADVANLGEQLDGTDEPENAFVGLKDNQFNSWQISHRVDFPVSTTSQKK